MQANTKLKSLPEIEQLLHIEKRVTAANDELAIVKSESDQIALELRRGEVDVETVTDRIKKDEARLSSGNATPKELEQLQHEVETLKKRQESLEEIELEIMIRNDAVIARSNTLTTDLASLQTLKDEISGRLQSATDEINKVIAEKNTARNAVAGKIEKVTVDDFSKKCPLILTTKKPGGRKTNNASVNIFKYWSKDKNNNNRDPLLYSNGLTGLYAKVPADFGWKFNNNIYPYPTLYPQSRIDMSGEWVKKQNQFSKYIKEYVDPLSTSNVQKSDSTSVSKSYLGNQIDPRTIMSKKEKYNRSIGQEMINFNNSLIKQKELIPKYCTTPIHRQQDNSRNITAAFNNADVSMYNLCRDFGGLWVYGAGTSEFKCACRDMSNPTLTMSLKSSTGDINIGAEIDKTQKSRNWSHEDSLSMISNAVAFASAFIPVVGPFISAGISLGNSAYHWNQGKQKEAAVDAFFALLPMLGKIPGVGSISKNLAKDLSMAVLESKALTIQELNALKRITQFDEVISKQMLRNVEKAAEGKISQHIIKTSIKKAEGALVDYTGLPTRKDVKKAIANKTLGLTTNLT